MFIYASYVWQLRVYSSRNFDARVDIPLLSKSTEIAVYFVSITLHVEGTHCCWLFPFSPDYFQILWFFQVCGHPAMFGLPCALCRNGRADWAGLRIRATLVKISHYIRDGFPYNKSMYFIHSFTPRLGHCLASSSCYKYCALSMTVESLKLLMTQETTPLGQSFSGIFPSQYVHFAKCLATCSHYASCVCVMSYGK